MYEQLVRIALLQADWSLGCNVFNWLKYTVMEGNIWICFKVWTLFVYCDSIKTVYAD